MSDKIIKNSAKKIALYPGSFDPITFGHLDILKRATTLFDEIIITVAHNSKKQELFTARERIDLIKSTIMDDPDFHNVRVEAFDKLLVNYFKECKACAVIRGLRAISDFDFEFQMALMNKKLYDRFETVFLVTRADYLYISSSLVKELYRLGAPIDHIVSKPVIKALKNKINL
jgi:pantetheine-phosphate adenylyltransferase